MTYFEISSLMEGRRVMKMISDGVTSGEEAELKRLAAELEN